MKFRFEIFLMILINYEISRQQNLKSWNPEITERIKEQSEDSKRCISDSQCRNWNSIRNIAMCKAGQLQKLMDQELQGHTLFYTETSYKSLEQTGWSKFLFSVISAENKERTHMIKICVPTDKMKNSWLSGICVWEPCGEISLEEECRKKMDDAKFIQLKQVLFHSNSHKKHKFNRLQKLLTNQLTQQNQLDQFKVAPSIQCSHI